MVVTIQLVINDDLFSLGQTKGHLTERGRELAVQREGVKGSQFHILIISNDRVTSVKKGELSNPPLHISSSDHEWQALVVDHDVDGDDRIYCSVKSIYIKENESEKQNFKTNFISKCGGRARLKVE